MKSFLVLVVFSLVIFSSLVIADVQDESSTFESIIDFVKNIVDKIVSSDEQEAVMSLLPQEEALEPVVNNSSWGQPQFPFRYRDRNTPANVSRIRPHLIKNNMRSKDIKDLLEQAGFLVRSVSFGLDKDGYYVMAASIEISNENYDHDSKEVLETLFANAYADSYGVELVNSREDTFVDYVAPRATISDFVSDRINQESFNEVAGGKVEVLPPPRDLMFPNKR